MPGVAMNNKHLTPVWIVYVDGQRLDITHEGALQRIVVDDKLNDVGLATLEFDTSYLQVRDAGTFWLESEVSVHLGYKDDCQQVFVGEVTEFIQEYREYGHQRLKVVCKNCLHRLQNAHQTLSFEFKTLSEALVSRLESYGIKAHVDSFGTKKYFVESQMTDYEFLMESANKYGKTVYAHGNKVYVKDEVTISNEDVVLEWGKSLVYFRGRESLKGQLSGCSFVGWDNRKGQGITGRVSLGEVPVKVGGGRSWEDNSKAAGGRWHSTIMEESLRDREEAVVLAKAYLQNLSMQYQMAECKCEGDQRILPGMRVTVKYVGESYSGEYIANHVLHEFSVYGGYTTTLYLKRNMAGGEKKRVSEIERERASRAVAEQQAKTSSQGVDSASSSNQEARENEKNPAISNPRWEDTKGQAITKALVGDEIYLCADITDIADGATATIKIVEKDADGKDDPVTTLSAVVSGGRIKCRWQVKYTADEDDADSQKELAEKGYTLPEYAFVVECGGATSGESGVLEVRGWIKIQFSKEEFDLLKNCKFYIYAENWESEDIEFKDDTLYFNEIPFLIGMKWKLGVRF